MHEIDVFKTTDFLRIINILKKEIEKFRKLPEYDVTLLGKKLLDFEEDDLIDLQEWVEANIDSQTLEFKYNLPSIPLDFGETQICPHCGSYYYGSDSNFCQNCGSKM